MPRAASLPSPQPLPSAPPRLLRPSRGRPRSPQFPPGPLTVPSRSPHRPRSPLRRHLRPLRRPPLSERCPPGCGGGSPRFPSVRLSSPQFSSILLSSPPFPAARPLCGHKASAIVYKMCPLLKEGRQGRRRVGRTERGLGAASFPERSSLFGERGGTESLREMLSSTVQKWLAAILRRPQMELLEEFLLWWHRCP